jgi:hypothetical protein
MDITDSKITKLKKMVTAAREEFDMAVTRSASFQGYRICQGTKRLPLHGMGERWQAVR